MKQGHCDSCEKIRRTEKWHYVETDPPHDRETIRVCDECYARFTWEDA